MPGLRKRISLPLLASLICALPAAAQEEDYCEPCRQLGDAGNCSELLLTLSVNRQAIANSHLILKRGERYWLPDSAVSQFNVENLPSAQARALCGERYYPHDAFEQAAVSFDLNRLHAELTLPAQLFSKRSLSQRYYVFTQPDPAPLGATLQYDIAARSQQDMTASSFLDFNITAGTGYGKANFTLIDAFDTARLVRRQTFWRQDDTRRLTTLILGDSAINSSRAFRGNVVYGGVSWGTNYELRRGIAYYPTITLEGTAELPSTVDLYINNVLQQSENVEPGPFEIEHPVGFTNTGDVELVIRDALGREQVITTEFFTDQELLNPGYADWSVDAGTLRDNFGIDNFNYGSGFASASYAYGLHRRFTGAVEAEGSGNHGALGVSGIWLLAANTKLHFAVAGSDHQDRGDGLWGRLRFSTHIGRFGFNLGGEAADEQFFRLGMSASGSLNRYNAFANGFIYMGHAGNFNAGVVTSETQDGRQRRAASLGYNLRAGAYHFGVNASQDLQQSDIWFAQLTISRDFGETQHRLTGNFSQGRQRYNYQMGYHPRDERHSYQLATSWGPDQASTANLGFSGFNEEIQYSLASNYVENESMPLTLQLRGGFGQIGSYGFAARDVNHGFVLVHVPEHPGVSVLRAGKVGETDENGFLLFPIYDYYRPLSVSLAAADLPLGVSNESLEKTVVPAYQAALYTRFDLVYQRNATLVLTDASGQPLRQGVTAYLNEAEQPLYTTVYGEVYLEELKPTGNSLWVPDLNCRIHFDYPADSRDPLPFLGEFRCGESEQR